MNSTRIRTLFLLIILVPSAFPQEGFPAAADDIRTLCRDGQDPNPSIKEEIFRLTPGTMLELRLSDKRKLIGNLGRATAEYFELLFEKGEDFSGERIYYRDIVSFKVRSREHRFLVTKIVLGIAIGVAVVVISLANHK